MSALILYWSIFGTTRQIAETIAQGLHDERVECELRDLRQGVPSDAADYDVIGVGFPVHWYRPPPPVTEAIAGLGRLDGRSIFAFCLYGTYRGAALNRARAALANTGGAVIGAFACHGEGHFYAYSRLGWGFSPGHPDAVDLEDARAFGGRMAAAHETARRGGGVTVSPADPPTPALYALERAVVAPWLVRALLWRFFRADPALCTRCGKCARECPTGAIAWERGAMPAWSRECVLCVNCVATCPEEAVSCPIDWVVVRPFIRWNVRRALGDPELEHARVAFRRGKFTRL